MFFYRLGILLSLISYRKRKGCLAGENMKIGVLSDTHLREVTSELRGIYDMYLADMDLILHLGDIVSPEVVRFLSKKPFHCVHGNMDPPDLKEILPRKKVLELDSYRLGITHGWGVSEGIEDRIRPEFNNVDIIVYGHSHRAANHVSDGVLFFNPGTATGYSSSGIHSIGVLELGDAVRGEIITV